MDDQLLHQLAGVFDPLQSLFTETLLGDLFILGIARKCGLEVVLPENWGCCGGFRRPGLYLSLTVGSVTMYAGRSAAHSLTAATPCACL